MDVIFGEWAIPIIVVIALGLIALVIVWRDRDAL